MRYMRYTAYVCMFGRRGKGAEISLMGVRFFEIAIPLMCRHRREIYSYEYPQNLSATHISLETP